MSSSPRSERACNSSPVVDWRLHAKLLDSIERIGIERLHVRRMGIKRLTTAHPDSALTASNPRQITDEAPIQGQVAPPATHRGPSEVSPSAIPSAAVRNLPSASTIVEKSIPNTANDSADIGDQKQGTAKLVEKVVDKSIEELINMLGGRGERKADEANTSPGAADTLGAQLHSNKGINQSRTPKDKVYKSGDSVAKTKTKVANAPDLFIAFPGQRDIVTQTEMMTFSSTPSRVLFGTPNTIIRDKEDFEVVDMPKKEDTERNGKQRKWYDFFGSAGW